MSTEHLLHTEKHFEVKLFVNSVAQVLYSVAALQLQMVVLTECENVVRRSVYCSIQSGGVGLYLGLLDCKITPVQSRSQGQIIPVRDLLWN